MLLVFQAIGEGEEKTEIARQVLAEQVLFEPYTAFKRIDQLRYRPHTTPRKGYIASADLLEFCEDNSVNVQDVSEISRLLDRIDGDRDGIVSYTE
jgi:Ca2+-binding EF-hand superfamily protein